MTARPPRSAIQVLEPKSGIGFGDLAELWQFRSLFRRFVARDLTLRYRQTALGATWVVGQPLLAAGIFGLVFGRVAHLSSNGISYFVFSFAGLLVWNAFSNGLSKATASLVGNAALVGKVYFPRLLLPLSAVASTVIDLVVSLVAMAILLAIYGIWPGLPIALTEVWLLIALVMTAGVGMLASSFAVRYRDVAYAIPMLVQFLLYASPVAYSLTSVPKSVRLFFVLNPLTGILEGIRWSLLGTTRPSAGLIIYSVIAAAVVFVIGLAVFDGQGRKFADVI